MTEITTTPLKRGDEVRDLKTGRLWILEDINTDGYAERNESWADVRSHAGDHSTFFNSPEEVELVRRSEDIPARTLPTLKEVAEYVSSTLHSGWGDVMSIDETDTNEPDGQLLAYGESSTGQRFGFRVTISELEKTDI